MVTEEYKSEIVQTTTTPTDQTVVINKTYGTVNGISQINLDSENASPGIYRQTIEQNGMYSPFRKYSLRSAYVTPSRNCASQKIIPAHPQQILQKPYEIQLQYNDHPQMEMMKYSNSLPRIGQNMYERHTSRHLRPKSAYIYENVHARDEFCVNNDCNINRTKSDRIIYSNVPNVKVRNFPTLQYSPSYVQEKHSG